MNNKMENNEELVVEKGRKKFNITQIKPFLNQKSSDYLPKSKLHQLNISTIPNEHIINKSYQKYQLLFQQKEPQFQFQTNINPWEHQSQSPFHTNMLHNLSANIKQYQNLQKKISFRYQFNQLKNNYRCILQNKINSQNRPATVFQQQQSSSKFFQFRQSGIIQQKSIKVMPLTKDITKTVESCNIRQINKQKKKNYREKGQNKKEFSNQDLFEKRNVFKIKSHRFITESCNNNSKQLKIKINKKNTLSKECVAQKKMTINQTISNNQIQNQTNYIKNAKNRNLIKKQIQMILEHTEKPLQKIQKIQKFKIQNEKQRQKNDQRLKFFMRKIEQNTNSHLQTNLMPKSKPQKIKNQFGDDKLFRFR